MEALVKVEALKKYFIQEKTLGLILKAEVVKAVDDISFDIYEGESFGLVGESGSGKSTTGRLVLGLIAASGGHVYFRGNDIFALNRDGLRKLRREMQIIFQDPYSSLNPRRTVGQTIDEALDIHQLFPDKAERKERVIDLLEKVGMGRPEYLHRYPHEFSGGQQQRIGIARALAVEPKFIVADEPVSSLDVSIQAQILNLLKKLQREFQLTYLVIAHNLGVIRYVCERVGVMYLGKLVEIAPIEALFTLPAHPYTRALMSAVPVPNPELKREEIILTGDIPSPVNPPSGCRFHTRCFMKRDWCETHEPEFIEIRPNQFVACPFAE